VVRVIISQRTKLHLFSQLTVACLLLTIYSPVVRAQQIPSTVRFAPFYDPFETAGNKFTCSSGQFIGDDNYEIAFNYFRSVGLTEQQSAGIVGNLVHESGVNPKRAQNRSGQTGIQTINSIDPILADISGSAPEQGFGIAQWTSDGRQQNWLDFAEEKQADALSLELQLEFLLTELETNDELGYPELQEADDDLRQSTWIFLAFFERPRTVVDANKARDPVQPTSGGAKETLDTRFEMAESIINLYGGGFVPETGGCGFNFDTSEPGFAAIPSITLDGSPPGAHKASNCTDDFTPGAQSLKDFILDNFSPPVSDVQGYDCRAIVGGTSTSIHGMGRAIDIMVSALNTSDRETGDDIRNLLYNNAEAFGIQRIIWNRKQWSSEKDGWRNYTGSNAHTDHLHVEINLNASTNPDLAGQGGQ